VEDAPPVRYDDFARTLVSLGVSELTIRDGISLAKRGKLRVGHVSYDERGVPVAATIYVQSRSRPGVEHAVTIGIRRVKCTCEASTIRGDVCAHMVAALYLFYTYYRGAGLEFPLRDVVESYLERERERRSGRVLVR